MESELVRAFIEEGKRRGVITYLCKRYVIEEGQVNVFRVKELREWHVTRGINPKKTKFQHVDKTSCINDTCKIASWDGIITGDSPYILI